MAWHCAHSVALIGLTAPQVLHTEATLVPQFSHFNKFADISFLHLGHCMQPVTYIKSTISSKLYSQTQAAGNTENASEDANANSTTDDNVVHDADYKVEDDKKE